MRLLIRTGLLLLLLVVAILALPQAPLAAQDDPSEAPEAFVPSERLPADSAVSFPVDI